MQEFFQRQRNAAEKHGVTVRRHQTEQNSSHRSQDLIAVNVAKRSIQTHQGRLVTNFQCSQYIPACNFSNMYDMY